jgi:hypothetical protein
MKYNIDLGERRQKGHPGSYALDDKAETPIQ